MLLDSMHSHSVFRFCQPVAICERVGQFRLAKVFLMREAKKNRGEDQKYQFEPWKKLQMHL